jgi:hypothetical protein
MADDTEHEHEPEHGEHATEHKPPDDKKGGLWKKHKVEIIAAAVGIAITIYLYYRSKQNAATTGAQASPTGAVTPSGTGSLSGGGTAGSGWTGWSGTGSDHTPGSNPITAAIDTLTTDVEALTSALTTSPVVNPVTATPAAVPAAQTQAAQTSAANVAAPVTTISGKPIAATVTTATPAKTIVAPSTQVGSTGSDIGQLAHSVGLIPGSNPAAFQGVPKASQWAYNPSAGKFQSLANYSPAGGSTIYIEQTYLNKNPTVATRFK